MSEVEFYRCEVCGNIVVLVNKGGGTLVCCDKEMTKLVPNTVDASKEKHVPYVTKENGKIKVAVGSVPHPMIPEHYIQWIAIAAGGRLEFKYLKPGEDLWQCLTAPSPEPPTSIAICTASGKQISRHYCRRTDVCAANSY